MSRRFYVYRLFDNKSGELVFQGRVDIPEQTDHATMNDDDARSMVADAAIRKMIRTGARPLQSTIKYCELSDTADERLSGQGEDGFEFDWGSCDVQEMELKLGEEE